MGASVDQLGAIARDLATAAGELAARRRREGVEIAATKSTIADIVTAADREVEASIRAELQRRRPDDGFLGEESDASDSASGITWVVDPIDGTVNYARGIPAYAVSIAAVSGEPDPQRWRAEASAVYSPSTDELYTAVRGGGAWCEAAGERTRLRVSDGPFPARALVATGFGYDPATHPGDLARLEKVFPLVSDIRRIGAASLDLAYVAGGRIDGFFERGLQPWDHAAGALLVEEAGGLVTGEPGGRPGRAMTIAAGPWLHARLASIITETP